MSVRAPVSDRLSITLPDWRTALKKRVKRPRKPDILATLFICIAVVNAWDSVGALRHGHALGAIGDLGIAVAAWTIGIHHRRHGQPPIGWLMAYWGFIAMQIAWHG